MRCADTWAPTKFVAHKGRWRANRDRREVSPASRLAADLAAAAYSRALTDHAKGELLDLGCGSVPLFGMYRHLASNVICADWADTPHPSPYLDLEVDLRERLDLPSDTYDTVVLTDVIEHLPYPDRLFADIARILKQGGKAIVGVPFYYWLHEQPHDHHRYTEFRLRLFCDDHGLDVLELFPLGGEREVFFDTVSKILVQRQRPIRWLSGIPSFVGTRRRRPELAQRPTAMPLGYVLVAQKP